MSSTAHAFAAVCSVIIGLLVFFLGILENQPVAGLIGILTGIVIACTLASHAEKMIIKEVSNYRTYKGDLY